MISRDFLASARFLACGLLGGMVGLLGASPAEAARFMEARIERDGKPLLMTSFGVGDREEPAEVWRNLEKVTFKAEGPLKAGNEPGPELTLSGDIQVIIQWGEKPEATAKVEQLRLVRVAGTPDQWRLPPDEVTRTGQAAGLEMSTSSVPGLVPVLGLIGGAFLLLAALVLAVLWLVGRRTNDAEPG